MIKRIIAIGHRGAAGLEPENTLRSFRRACALGVDWIETDVHLTRDGHLVCIHDPTVDRTTDGSGVVRELSLIEIRKLDAGQGERVPTLQEAVAAVRGKSVLKIELKGEGTVRPTLQVIEAAGMSPNELTFTSFDADRVREVRSLRPGITASLLFSVPPPDAISRAWDVGASALAIQHSNLTRDLVDEAHQAGLEIRAWTMDTMEEMEAVLALGVDGITSNRPDIMMELLTAKGLRR